VAGLQHCQRDVALTLVQIGHAPGSPRSRCGRYRPSSRHGIVGIVGSDGTRRCMTRGRSTVMGFGGFGGFGSRFSKVRCGFTSRASAANLTASTSSNPAPAVREPKDIHEVSLTTSTEKIEIWVFLLPLVFRTLR
jgi:hypothetical protein